MTDANCVVLIISFIIVCITHACVLLTAYLFSSSPKVDMYQINTADLRATSWEKNSHKFTSMNQDGFGKGGLGDFWKH